jgi:ubiquinone/menaquinone biosynthesis C-methylase UbiE
VEEPYRKDMSHLTWDEVFARQERRAGLMEAWLNALQLRPGARVLDIGAGPGYISLVLAERVGPDGLVYAVDRSADALAYLERLQRERGVPQIQRVVEDARTLDLGALHPDAALVTMVLHHTDDPLAVLANVARLLPPGAPAVVAEFHPEGPCEVGPPRGERLSPDQVRAWSEDAGFEALTYTRQTPEHYMWIVRRRPAESAPARVGPDLRP